MKAVKLFRKIGSAAACALIFSLGALAQNEAASKKRERVTTAKADAAKSAKIEEAARPTPQQTPESAARKTIETGNQNVVSGDKQPDDKTMRREALSEEEAAVIPYYNSYMKEYRLGPQDVISIEIFGQCPDYCKTGISVPPTARISYPLIQEGVFVGGKTIQEVQVDIKKQLEEFIINPSVTVTLEKVGSARYSVLGDVGAPGVKMMERRMSVYEAIVESGGVLRTGDSKRVTIVRQTATGLTPITVNLKEIASGKTEMVYLVPGDQVIVPGNKIKQIDTVLNMIGKVSIFKLLFGGGL